VAPETDSGLILAPRAFLTEKKLWIYTTYGLRTRSFASWWSTCAETCLNATFKNSRKPWTFMSRESCKFCRQTGTSRPGKASPDTESSNVGCAVPWGAVFHGAFSFACKLLMYLSPNGPLQWPLRKLRPHCDCVACGESQIWGECATPRHKMKYTMAVETTRLNIGATGIGEMTRRPLQKEQDR
jgi:hypothetical protein